MHRGVARAALAFGSVQIVTRILTVLLAVAIARALDPREVGLLGLAGIIIGIQSLVGSCADIAGVTSHGRGSDVRYALAAVAIRGGLTAVLVGFTLLTLPAISHLLSEGVGGDLELAALVQLLLWQLGLELAGTFPRVLLQRCLDLSWIATASLMQVVTHVGLSLALLAKGYGSAGVVMACLAGAAVSAAVLWVRIVGTQHRNVEAANEGGMLRQALEATGKVVAARCIGYLNGRLDNLLVAGVLGPTAMSFYGMAWTASRQPIILLSEALDSVLTPTLAYVRGDAEYVRKVVREALSQYYLLLGLLCAWLFVLAPLLVASILGEKWLPLVPCLRVMSCTVLFGPLLAVGHSLLMATGRAHLIAFAATAQLLTLAAVLVPLLRRWSIVGAAFGDLASMAVLALALRAACRLTMPQIKWSVAREGGASIFAAGIAGVVGWTVGGRFADPWIRFVIESVLVTLGYVGIVWWLGGRDTMIRLVAILREVVDRDELGAQVATTDYRRAEK